jgi:putative ABC transport system substrate-binding protein
VTYDRAFANDQQQDLARLAVELVSRGPEVIYAPPTPAAFAAKRATNSIPIVFGAVWDPVGSGLVASLPHPSGNVTGLCVLTESLGPKRLELLREVLPKIKRLGWLGDETDPTTKYEREVMRPIAASYGITIIEAEASNPATAEIATQRLISNGAEVIYAGTSPLVYNLRSQVVEWATRRRIPVIAYRSELAEAGALFSYGASLPHQIRRSATYVDKILRGAKPGDLPIEQATEFELVVNLKAARSLGIELPHSILLRADRLV